MVVCQYFLKGTCKFGASCRNEHPSGGMGFGKSNSFSGFSKNQFASTGSNTFGRWQGSSSTDDSVDKVIQNIKQEMNLWEVSKMWPFSCFSHQKEAQCLTGLLDYSPEEIRLEAYKANASGTIKKYLQSVNQLSEKFMRRRVELKSLTVASWDQEKRRMSSQNSSGLFTSQSTTNSLFSSPSLLFSSQPTQSGTNNPFAASSSKPSLFGASTGHSVFGQISGPAKTPLFGSNQPSSFGSGTSSLFGSGSYSAFGSKQQSSIFSSGQQSAITGGQQSLFSSGQQSAVTGGQQSIFSSGQQSAVTGGQQSIFSSGQQSAVIGGQQSLFSGGQQSVFGGGQQSAFGGQVLSFQEQQAISGGRPQTALEGGQLSSFGGGLFSKGEQTSQSLFGQTAQQQSSLFGQPTNTLGSTATNPALESRVQQTTATTSGSHNPFLQASIQNKSLESASAVPELPSTLKLSEKDIEAYKAKEFIIGQVPECPPPVELC